MSQLENTLTIIQQLNFDNEVEAFLMEYIQKHHKRLFSLVDFAYDSDDLDYPLCKKHPLTRLAVVCCKLTEVKQWFDSKHIPEAIFYDTVGDVGIKQKQYQEKTNKIGLSKDHVIWFRHLFHHHIFKLGTLQFQMFKMVYLDDDGYMTYENNWKEKLLEDTPVLNLHIQQKSDISTSAVQQSISIAHEFFHTYFPDFHYQEMICYSWLLYPTMVKYLPRTSHIYQFAQFFEIIGEVDDNSYAIKYIFANSEKQELPLQTSLQKFAYSHLDCLGFACGVMRKEREYV